MRDTRVKFYSVSDLSCGYYLQKAEIILNEYDENKEYCDVNTILEFYNVQLYLFNQCYLAKWDRETIDLYQRKARKFNKTIGIYFSRISDNNIIKIYSNIYDDYYIDFWTLFDKYRLYNKISQDIFEILLNEKLNLRHVITHKEIVEKYDHIISNIMIHNVCSCELLLDEYLADKGENMKYYFPQSLIKTKLVEMYVESERANLNYLKLIFESLSSNDLILSDRLRLNAKRKYENSVKKFLDTNATNSNNVGVIFSKEQNEQKKL